MTSPAESDRRGTIVGGCAIALASALVTCFMLFINGSFVWALLAALEKSGLTWASKPEVSQFILFLFPVMLVVAEWMMIDYVRSRLRQPREDE